MIYGQAVSPLFDKDFNMASSVYSEKARAEVARSGDWGASAQTRGEVQSEPRNSCSLSCQELTRELL
jgi:hypothetical protein